MHYVFLFSRITTLYFVASALFMICRRKTYRNFHFVPYLRRSQFYQKSKHAINNIARSELRKLYGTIQSQGGASAIILNNMNKINPKQSTAKHNKSQVLCIILGMQITICTWIFSFHRIIFLHVRFEHDMDTIPNRFLTYRNHTIGLCRKLVNNYNTVVLRNIGKLEISTNVLDYIAIFCCWSQALI